MVARLVKCRECRGEIARSAKRCPHCDAEKPTRGRLAHGLHKLANFLIVVGLLLTILAVLAALL